MAGNQRPRMVNSKGAIPAGNQTILANNSATEDNPTKDNRAACVAMAPTARKREIDRARSVATCAMEVELLRTAMSWAISTLGTTVMAQRYIGMFQPTPQVILQMVSAYTSKACV